jgi:phage portal protein BeeE
MGLFAAVKDYLLEPIVAQPVMQERTVLAYPFDYPAPSFEQQLAALRRAGLGPWRAASITDALGVPAIFGAVNLIASQTGQMSMTALRDEVELPPDQRPRVIVRPDPFTIPREFFRSTAWNLASRGEAWWWAAKRNADGEVLSVINCNPAEVNVEDNPRDPRYPIITWRDRPMDNDDFRQLVWAKEPGALRGVGPLQMCGAAVSVAVEAQEWAANFYAGGTSAIWVKTSIPLSGGDQSGVDGADSETEVQRFLDQWMNKSPNVPRVTDDTVEDIKSIDNIPGTILDVAMSGQSLTYQNVGSEFENFLKRCLRPNVLEVMEQTMSDFLTRRTVARFNTEMLTLADIKTRYDVYKVGIETGIIDAEEARKFEGLAPGDVENAPVPFSPPQAIPTAASMQERSEVRCENVVPKTRAGITRMDRCGKLLSTDGTRPSFCPRCKATVAVA